MKTKISLYASILFLFIFFAIGHMPTYADDSISIVAGNEYTFTLPAGTSTFYTFTSDCIGEYNICVSSDLEFNCIISSWNLYNSYNYSFALNHNFYQDETCSLNFFNPGTKDITVTLLIKPTFLPEISMEADAVSLRKGKKLTLNLNCTAMIKEIKWSSSDKKIATVNSKGVVKGVSEGMATITVTGTTTSEQVFTDTYDIYVSNPTLSSKNISLNIYGLNKDYGYYYPANNYLEITGINPYSKIEIIYPEKKLSINAYKDGSVYATYIFPIKKGESKIKFTVDGKQLTCNVNVFNAYFVRNKKTVSDFNSKKWNANSSMLAMYKGEKTTLKVKGFSSQKIKWSSSNKKVATVNKKGVVSAKGNGNAVITARIGTASLSYHIGVSYKNAINAVRYANKHFGSTYSQAKRMEEGYYDCSSFAWRSYNSTGMNVGPLTNWAPTAADMAAWCTENGYMMSSGIVDTSDLLPGDLIFLCGENNGRYNGIYHVDVYQGNYSSITVEDMYHCSDYMYNVMVARPCATNSVSLKTISPALTVNNTNKRNLTLKWSLMHDCDGYIVYRKIGDNGKYQALKTIEGEGNITFTNKNLKKNKNYYYKVRAYRYINGKRIYSQYSNEICYSIYDNINQIYR